MQFVISLKNRKQYYLVISLFFLVICLFFFFRENLLRRCWSREATDRPPAAAIVEYLASDPEFITPCLDVPAVNINFEDTMEILDVKALDRGRKHSFTSLWQSRKNALLADPNQPGCSDATHLVQAGFETGPCRRPSGGKRSSKKSLYGSFKKAVDFLSSDPDLITPYIDVPTMRVDLENSLETLDVKALDRARVHSFSTLWQTRKRAAHTDPNQPGCSEGTQLVQAGLETVRSMNQFEYSHPSQKSLHESYKKAKRDLSKDRTSEDLSQITYL